jgi:hypothetical protein
MKTMKNSVLMLAALLISGSIFATGNLKVNFSGVKSDLAVIEISNVNTSALEIELKNDAGDVIFSKETQPTANYKKNYDFSKLEDGKYSLIVRVDNESHETEFEVKRGNLNLLGEKKIVEPYFSFNNNELKMTYLNFSKEKAVMYVFDVYGNELYSKKFNYEFNVQHGLNLSRLPQGTYSVLLSTEGNSYNYDVSVK